MHSTSSPRAWLGLEALALLSVYSAVALAQGNENNTPTAPPRNTPSPTTGNNEDNNEDNNNDDDDDDDNDDDNRNEDADQKSTSQEDRPPARTSATPEPSTSSSRTTPQGPLPTITGAPADDDDTPPLPTLSNFVDYSYPPPAVPPTINAPFMDRSTMPEGTVFIVVGAILGAFGLAILVWRAIVACLLHRSVARAAAAQHVANEKSTHLPPVAARRKTSERKRAAGQGSRRTTRGPVPSSTPSQSNLFFSPTAAGTAAAAANRDSRYLPPGFYAAGSSPLPPQGGSNLRPDSRGQQFSSRRDHSPEGSPQYAARHHDPSMSSLNLNYPPSQRAPSAYLDDLLDENPQMFPPSQMPQQTGRHQRNYSHSSQGRR